MNLTLALSNTPAGRWLFLGLVCAALKLVATAVQIALLRGNYRHRPNTRFFQAAYLMGKTTPALAAACVCVSSVFRRDWVSCWFFGLLALGIALLALYVVRLREQGRFFGVLDVLSKRNT